MRPAPSLEHLLTLTDDVGILQHATYDVPNRNEGYCTDDVARAFIVAVEAANDHRNRAAALGAAGTYLAFLRHAQREDGRFHNFMSYERTWLDDGGSADSNGRAVWALGHGVRFAQRDSWRELCGVLLERVLPSLATLKHVRARAYAVLGLAHAHVAGLRDPRIVAELRATAAALAAAHAGASGRDWDWFEDRFTYDNARLPEALLRIGTVLDDRAAVALGLRTLAFYEAITIEDGRFVPIGNRGWFERGGPRARFDQQPIEALGLVDAALAASAAADERRWHALANCGLDWFYGRNLCDAVMVRGGGCFDGLEERGVNRNMGAESTLAYLASAFALGASGADALRAVR